MSVLVIRTMNYSLTQVDPGEISQRNPHKKSNPHSCRDEIKRDKSAEEKRIKIISNFRNVKKIWVHPEFQNLRHFVDIASNNPSVFPKNFTTSIMANKNSDEALLSKCFVWKM